MLALLLGAGIVYLALAVWGARVDPQFMQVFARHIKHRPLLDV
jgi:type IV secretion system protein VirB3